MEGKISQIMGAVVDVEFADGKSLLEIKINHLKKSGCFDQIYISSDSDKVKQIANDNDINFLERIPLCVTRRVCAAARPPPADPVRWRTPCCC